ncbi:MAG: ABC transporter ATP-binding protein [Candidatus Magasanikbacteria bacterium]|nr:ABC transporter ATP-binding protein [Candidatus Magasanikbacteria bacterium]
MISTKNLCKYYGEEENLTKAVDNVTLKVDKGEFVAIIGPSGSGKSTLMHIIGCLDKPTSGQYFLDNKQLIQFSENELAKIRNEQIGFVFQSFNLLPRTSAQKNVELPLVYAKVGARDREIRAQELLTKLGLGEKFLSTPAKLSGGQQQRVAIARALINNPLILLADEPTGNLDTKASYEIMDILKNLNREGITVIMITHELDIAKQAKRVIAMRDGKIVSDKKISKNKK